MSKAKKVLGIILRVYAIFCMCVVTILIIAALITWINFGRITASVVEKVVDNYNYELNEFIHSYFAASVPDDSIQFESLQTIKGGGLQAAFRIDNNALADIDINSFKDKNGNAILNREISAKEIEQLLKGGI